jgi:hypothetical protein
MHLPHPLITLPIAASCWLVVGVCHDVIQTKEDDAGSRNPLAICRSAYGSLIARLMKNSLESYWHGGNCADPSHGHAVPAKPSAAPALAAASAPAVALPSAGRFARRQAGTADGAKAPLAAAAPHVCGDNCNHAAVPSAVAEAETESWIERLGKGISRIEHMRSVRNSPFAVAPTHQRFLSASADWRVHIAWTLDPCDAALYEVDYYTAISRGPSRETAKQKAERLSRETIQHALSERASLADALTGAGAAINLLNDQLQPNRPTPPDVAGVWRDWRVLKFCLTRHEALRQQADEEDWWADIPEVRRQEIDSYARMLVHLTGTIRQQLTNSGLVRVVGAP